MSNCSSDAMREAREAIKGDSLWFHATHMESLSCAADDRGDAIEVVDASIRQAEEARKAYDDFRAATVRAAAIAEVRGVVEAQIAEERNYSDSTHPVRALTAALARLDALAGA